MTFSGYIQDTHDPNDRKASALLTRAASPILGSGISLRAFAGTALNQGGAGSCVPTSLSKVVQSHWRIRGDEDPPLPNILAIFWQSRKSHGAEDRDEGTYPRHALGAMRTYGFCLESEYPYSDDPKKILSPVPPKVYRASYDQANQLEYYRISDDADDRKEEMKLALEQMRPFNLAIPVDDAFRVCDGVTPYTYRGNLLGWHYIAAYGYDDRGLLCLNSWGDLWGDGGFFILSWEMALYVARDPYVITFVPRVSVER